MHVLEDAGHWVCWFYCLKLIYQGTKFVTRVSVCRACIYEILITRQIRIFRGPKESVLDANPFLGFLMGYLGLLGWCLYGYGVQDFRIQGLYRATLVLLSSRSDNGDNQIGAMPLSYIGTAKLVKRALGFNQQNWQGAFITKSIAECLWK